MITKLPKLIGPTDRWLATADIMQLFGVTDRCVRRWRSEGMPYINEGRPYSKQSDVIEWLANRKRKGRKIA
jgi:phage terminase Nu1 subunit (DNA packaging protein)